MPAKLQTEERPVGLFASLNGRIPADEYQSFRIAADANFHVLNDAVREALRLFAEKYAPIERAS